MNNTDSSYNDLKKIYSDYFSTGYVLSIQNKLALFDLLGLLTTTLQSRKPDVTYYQVLSKLAEGSGLTESEIKKIAVIAEDFCYQCKDFVDFGLTIKEVPAKIKEILHQWLPF